MTALVDAIWEGPYIGELNTPQGRLELVPGVTVAQVTPEDLLSTHWRERPKIKAVGAAAKGSGS